MLVQRTRAYLLPSTMPPDCLPLPGPITRELLLALVVASRVLGHRAVVLLRVGPDVESLLKFPTTRIENTVHTERALGLIAFNLNKRSCPYTHWISTPEL